jgi:pyruvate dehydrogenase E2 component (dihydrolipoamide acetyltransferase)
MVDIVRLPKLGLSDYGELTSWEVSLGDPVSEGDILATIESDKAIAEVEAPIDGTLLATYVEVGEEIAIEPGRPVAVLGGEGEAAPEISEIPGADEVDGAGAAPDETAAAADEPAADGTSTGEDEDLKVTPRARRYAEEHDVDLGAVEGTGPQGSITEDDVEAHAAASTEMASEERGAVADAADVKATPRAKRAARDRGVDLGGVEGTGPQGAITEDDVAAHADAHEGAIAASTADETATAPGELTVSETRTLSGTRRTIAERLSQSAREKPHVMGTREISVERLLALRDHLAARNVEVSVNDLLLHFVGRVLQDLPRFNALFEDGEHRLVEEVNVGYAVDGPNGLVVPVVSDVPNRSLAALSRERADLVERTLAGDHRTADLQGGTFTVTNIGVLDMDTSFSIINPPQVAILAVGRRKPIPVDRDGDIEFVTGMTFSLTIDHRVLDGADSGAFLDRVADYVAFPGQALDAVDRD